MKRLANLNARTCCPTGATNQDCRPMTTASSALWRLSKRPRDARYLHELRNSEILQGCARVSLWADGFDADQLETAVKGLAGATRARASARARQPDAARNAAIHAVEPAIEWRSIRLAPICTAVRERLGNGDGEFPLAEASSSPVNARSAVWHPLFDLLAQHECGQASTAMG